MDIKEITTIATAALSVVGGILVLWKRISSALSANREKSRNSIREASNKFADDSEFCGFLKDLERQMVLEEVTGLRLGRFESGALFAFHKSGVASFHEIRKAWGHRVFKNNDGRLQLTFELTRTDQFLILLGRLYSTFCGLCAIAAFIIAFLPTHETSSLYIVFSFLMVASATVPIFSIDSELTANRIIRREKKYSQLATCAGAGQG